jgi:hypothetical protein
MSRSGGQNEVGGSGAYTLEVGSDVAEQFGVVGVCVFEFEVHGLDEVRRPTQLIQVRVAARLRLRFGHAIQLLEVGHCSLLHSLVVEHLLTHNTHNTRTAHNHVRQRMTEGEGER